MIRKTYLSFAAFIALIPSLGNAENWTGAYAGASLDGINGEAAASAFAGAQYHYGYGAIGLELGYARLLGGRLNESETDNFYVNQILDVGLRLGYANDDVFIYAGYGASGLGGNSDSSGSSAITLGLGVDYHLNETTFIGVAFKDRLDIGATIGRSIGDAITGGSNADETDDLRGVSFRIARKF